jgi:hypothetical protein
VNLEGLTENSRGKKSVWYENESNEVVAKKCSKCSEPKPLDDFPNQSKGVGGKSAECKACAVERVRKYREENPDIAVKYRDANRKRRSDYDKKWYAENRERKKRYNLNRKPTNGSSERRILYKRRWIEANREKKNAYDRKWRRENPEKEALIKQRRRAVKRALPNDLTSEKYMETLNYFGNACALTGIRENIELEHAIPLSIGHGGTTFGNCYPITRGLNQSKYNYNMFEWFDENKDRFELSQDRFNRLVDWLAIANNMTVEEYRDYVYECHANPNEINDAKAN